MSTQEVAKTILSQLGGNRFIVMTGSKNFTSSPDSLSMKLTRNTINATHLVITLEANDTYTMEFLACRLSKTTGISRKSLKRIEDVYAEDLQPLFTEVTGLYTSMGTMGRK